LKYCGNGKFNFLIYRSFNYLGLTKYRIVKRNNSNFIQNEIFQIGSYTYAVKLIYEDGGDSTISKQKMVVE
jgi:hypothetical protein